MSSHSKRNTSLAFFTAHERSLLKDSWGSQSTRLNRDSFLPFASCNLCLQSSVDPVACATNGEVFCRECIVSNLLSQRKEIKRLEKEDEKRRAEDVEREREKGEEDEKRAVEDFERTMLGFEGRKARARDTTEEEKSDTRGVKRKFELDEEEMLKNARQERTKARQAIEDEKSAKNKLPSFWIPSMTPSTSTNTSGSSNAPALKLQPLCPLSSPTNKHNLSLKSLVSINFKKSSVAQTSHPDRLPYICPACDKNLSNASKAVLTVPCGHVLCRSCAKKFVEPDGEETPDPHADPKEPKNAFMRCYVCDANLSTKPKGKKDSGGNGKAEKGVVKPGLVELKSEGTGFAGGGDNMVTQKGTAFQC